MKINVKDISFEELASISGKKHVKPEPPKFWAQALVRLLSIGELKKVKFSSTSVGMEKLGADEPCLILMNHSSFIDLKIASKLLFPRKYNIVCTSDGFVGKEKLMRMIGCIPTQKFVTDPVLVKDIYHLLKKEKSSVLMYPEASYSFDGTATPLPQSVGKLIKMLKVPVVMIRTHGAFARDPLYNNLQIRKVDVSAEMKYLISPEDAKEKTASELQDIVNAEFDFDYFRWQRDHKIQINETFRADYLHRVLYKCPHCFAESKTVGKGTILTCKACGATYELTEYGALEYVGEKEGKFDHIPDWYGWQRKCVVEEIANGSYRLDLPVEICVLVDTKSIYRVGEGRLVHDSNGFCLDGCEGKLYYEQKPQSSYSLYSDYYWYELGDMICIGDNKILYYCFPKGEENVVAKARIAAEELYKVNK